MLTDERAEVSQPRPASDFDGSVHAPVPSPAHNLSDSDKMADNETPKQQSDNELDSESKAKRDDKNNASKLDSDALPRENNLNHSDSDSSNDCKSDAKEDKKSKTQPKRRHKHQNSTQFSSESETRSDDGLQAGGKSKTSRSEQKPLNDCDSQTDNESSSKKENVESDSELSDAAKDESPVSKRRSKNLQTKENGLMSKDVDERPRSRSPGCKKRYRGSSDEGGTTTKRVKTLKRGEESGSSDNVTDDTQLSPSKRRQKKTVKSRAGSIFGSDASDDGLQITSRKTKSETMSSQTLRQTSDDEKCSRRKVKHSVKKVETNSLVSSDGEDALLGGSDDDDDGGQISPIDEDVLLSSDKEDTNPRAQKSASGNFISLPHILFIVSTLSI